MISMTFSDMEINLRDRVELEMRKEEFYTTVFKQQIFRLMN